MLPTLMRRNMLKKIFKAISRKKDTLEEGVCGEALPQEAVKQRSEQQLILKNIVQLDTLTVKDAMVPRSDIVWVDLSLGIDQILHQVKNSSHTRYPVCHKSLDNILGKIHIKEILLGAHEKKEVNLKQHLEKLLFASPAMPCLDLLVKMKEEKTYMAIIVDEFGGVDGLVTADNLIEKVVGQFEFSQGPALPFYEYDAGSRSVVAEGRCPIDEFERNFGTVLTSQEREADPETLAGLVLLMIGRMPNRGEVIKHSSGLVLEVVEIHNRRIKTLRIYNVGRLSQGEVR